MVESGTVTVQIGNVTSQPGAVVRGHIRVGSLADGSPINVPLLVAEGVNEGPTVWIGACVHGEEYGGAASIIRFIEGLDPQQLRGTVIGVPVSNPPSFNAKSR